MLNKLILAGEKLNIQTYTQPGTTNNPYLQGVIPTPMPELPFQELNELIFSLVAAADYGFPEEALYIDDIWYRVCFHVLKAHHVYKETKDVSRAIAILEPVPQEFDWVVAAREWLQRREK